MAVVSSCFDVLDSVLLTSATLTGTNIFIFFIFFLYFVLSEFKEKLVVLLLLPIFYFVFICWAEVKSSRSLLVGLHTCYIGGDKKKQKRDF